MYGLVEVLLKVLRGVFRIDLAERLGQGFGQHCLHGYELYINDVLRGMVLKEMVSNVILLSLFVWRSVTCDNNSGLVGCMVRRRLFVGIRMTFVSFKCQAVCLVYSVAAMYSAPFVDSAMIFCLQDVQVTFMLLRQWSNPSINLLFFLFAQLALLNTWSGEIDCLSLSAYCKPLVLFSSGIQGEFSEPVGDGVKSEPCAVPAYWWQRQCPDDYDP